MFGPLKGLPLSRKTMYIVVRSLKTSDSGLEARLIRQIALCAFIIREQDGPDPVDMHL